MQWLEVRIETTPEGTEILPGLLLDYGITDIQIINTKEARDFLESGGNWDYKDDFLEADEAAVLFYICPTAKDTIARLQNDLRELQIPDIDLGTLELRQNLVDDEDWLHNWKENYKPFAIGNVIVRPFWEEYTPKEGEVVFTIDPGNIFGTGLHATTKMCVLALQEIKPHGSVLDLGCGSGILSIIALLLGAENATAVDIDPAVIAAEENARLNGVDSRYEVRNTDIFAEPLTGRYNIILANIVADVIIKLAPLIPGLLAEEGVFIASGIIDARLEEVRAAFVDAGLKASTEINFEKELEGWHALVCQSIL